MTKDVIELYNTLNTKGFSYEPTFGDFNDQTIPQDYCNFLNNDNNSGNNIPGTPVENVLSYKKGVEGEVVPNHEYIEDGIIINGNDSLALVIDPLQK